MSEEKRNLKEENLEDLTEEEMENLQGVGDITGERGCANPLTIRTAGIVCN